MFRLFDARFFCFVKLVDNDLLMFQQILDSVNCSSTNNGELLYKCLTLGLVGSGSYRVDLDSFLLYQVPLLLVKI